MKRYTLAGLLIVAVLFVAGWTFQTAPTRAKWEYKTIPIPLADEKLNALGDEGWELFAVGETTTSLGVRPVHYFKRQK